MDTSKTRIIAGMRVRVIKLKRAESILPIVRDHRRIHANTRRVLRTLEEESRERA